MMLPEIPCRTRWLQSLQAQHRAAMVRLARLPADPSSPPTACRLEGAENALPHTSRIWHQVALLSLVS